MKSRLLFLVRSEGRTDAETVEKKKTCAPPRPHYLFFAGNIRRGDVEVVVVLFIIICLFIFLLESFLQTLVHSTRWHDLCARGSFDHVDSSLLVFHHVLLASLQLLSTTDTNPLVSVTSIINERSLEIHEVVSIGR